MALTLLSVMDIDLLLIKPNEFVLGLALITWARIRQRGASSARFLFIMIFLMSGWHMIGKVWSVVSLLVYGWFARRPLTHSEKKWLVGSMGLILLFFLLPLLSVSGSGVPTLDGITKHSLLELFSFHLPAILDRFRSTIIFFKNPLFIVILLGIGMLSLSKQERCNTLFWLFLLVSLLLASLIDFQPVHPGHLLKRIWVMFIILLTGIFSYGIYHWANRLRRMTTEIWQTANNTSESTRSVFIWVLILGFSLSLVDQLAFQIYTSLKSTPHFINRFSTQHNFALGPAQPRLLFTGNIPCKNVLYTDITLIMYYLAYGGYDCGALRYSINPKSSHWLNAQPNISHLVTWNPITTNYGNLTSSQHRPITVHFDDKPKQGDWKIGLFNAGSAPVTAQLRQTTGKLILEKELPAGWKGWWNVGSTAQFANQTLVLVPANHEEWLLTGMRVGDSDQPGLRWPWDQGIKLSIADARVEGGIRFFSYSSFDLWPNSNKIITVLDDSGSSVLATVQ
ncbi:MAG: hypothetical protein HQL79_06920 [Magnetococcales bacterium]|nr:hypothetical protein [Magnetococcales bacterium]